MTRLWARAGSLHLPLRSIPWRKEARGIVNPQGCNTLFLGQRERIEIGLSHGLAHFVHHGVTHGQVGGNDTGAHVALLQLEDTQFKHFFAGGVLTMLDDAGHAPPSPFGVSAPPRIWLIFSTRRARSSTLCSSNALSPSVARTERPD